MDLRFKLVKFDAPFSFKFSNIMRFFVLSEVRRRKRRYAGVFGIKSHVVSEICGWVWEVLKWVISEVEELDVRYGS